MKPVFKTFLAHANPTSSTRTKNRLAAHGPNFLLLERGECLTFTGVESVLLQSCCNDWSGWFPSHEVTLKEL